MYQKDQHTKSWKLTLQNMRKEMDKSNGVTFIFFVLKTQKKIGGDTN